MPSNRRTSRRALSSRAESFVLMGTVVTIRVVGRQSAQRMRADIDRAMAHMRSVETTLSRFDENSALRRLCRTPGVLTRVPPMLFHALKVALEVASLTDGTFDPTIGGRMEALGFNRNYLTGAQVHSDFLGADAASFRDITLDDDGMRVRLDRPLVLDLGAVAKGLAVDLAARALRGWDGCAIDAGGDVYVAGVDPHGDTWSVGVEDPNNRQRLSACLRVRDAAVCTSGSYKRRSPRDPAAHHLLDAHTGVAVDGLLSCTVVGPQAMMADVVATAAFLLGQARAIPFIASMGLQGMCEANNHEISQTAGMEELNDERQTLKETEQK